MRQLALLLNVSYGKDLSFGLYRSNQLAAYRTIQIPKKDGSARVISAPRKSRKALQHALLPYLEELYSAPPCVHGAVKKKSVKTNASSHVGRRYLLNVDIEDFFPSIHFKRIVGLLASSRYGLHPSVATAIAQICCYQGRLPSGAPTSPIIANMVCGRLDSQMLRLAKNNRLRYTRYYDDITFSSSTSGHLLAATGMDLSSDHIAHGSDRLSEEFRDIFANNGFSINSKKVWGTTRLVSQQVTGVVVNKKFNVPQLMFRRARAMVHSLEKNGLDFAQHRYTQTRKVHNSARVETSLAGTIAYIGYITDYGKKYTTLARRFMEAVPGQMLPVPLMQRERAVYVAECMPGLGQATAFHIGSGLFVTAAHLIDANDPPVFIKLHCPAHYPVPLFAELVRINRASDVALLKSVSINSYSRPAIKLTIRQSNRGEEVEAYGFENYIAGNKLGIVPTKISSIRHLEGELRQSVASPWPHGMSGGPVFDMQGALLGIVFSGPIYGEKASPYGTAFTPAALFSNELNQWVQELAN